MQTCFQDVEEHDLFAAALALPVSERDYYLTRACGSDTALLHRINHLIRAFDTAASFVKEDAPSLDLATCIGPYKPVRELGEGGCGIAYLVEQSFPVKRQAALKVIKPGMDTKAVLLRFDAERQTLALLDHPNIAKVFDAGMTAAGRPYFVMELVRGIRITEFCAQCRLSVSERLLLFVQVCKAIQHAHQKGIIHRDVKPSNILVTMHDRLPVAKVIDFGIAKAIQGRLIDQTLHTEIDQILGTPAYISPEQTGFFQAAVDTRSDIYSLGVLLYELLTGCTPLDANELSQLSLSTLRARICKEEPVRPSRRLKAYSREQLERWARSTATTATKLVKHIRDDLDSIVLQCLEKDPAHRYQTVDILVSDIEHYLRHEPISARPSTFIYSVRKLARRNRVAFASTLAGVAMVGIFGVVMAIQAHRIAAERDLAQRERQRALRISNVALSVLGIADPFQNVGKDISESELLRQAGASIKRELADQPETRARLLQAIGRAYVRNGNSASSIDYLREAADLLTHIPGVEADAMVATIDLSSALRLSGELQAAREALAVGENIARSHKLERSAGYAKLLLERARIKVTEGRMADGRADIEQSLLLFKQTVGPRAIEVGEALAELAPIFMWNDDHEEAEKVSREAIKVFDEAASPMYPDRVSAEVNLAEALYLQDQFEEAAALLTGALRKMTDLFGHNSAAVADVLDRLAVVKFAQGAYVEAEQHSRDALAVARATYGEQHLFVANVSTTLGRTLRELGKYAEAETALDDALGIYTQLLPADHQYIASTEYLLGEVFLATSRLDQAAVTLIASKERWIRAGAPSWRAARSANALGEVLCRQGRREEGAKLLWESYRLLSTDPGAYADAKEKARERVARFLKKPPAPQPTPLLETTDASP